MLNILLFLIQLIPLLQKLISFDVVGRGLPLSEADTNLAAKI
jgi:hypothetical protein